MSMLTPGAGLDAAFATVYVQQQARVRRIAASRVMTGDPGIVEDIAQEAFTRLWKYVSDGHEVGNVEGLLSHLTWCSAAAHFRLSRTKREHAADFTDPVMSRRMPAARSAEDVAVARETVRDAVAAGIGGGL